MRVVVVTNIPTPYRDHFFSELALELIARDSSLHVLYAARTERNRRWDVTLKDAPFTFDLMAGIHIPMAGTTFHVNPAVARRLTALSPDIVIIGTYTDPTSQLAKQWCRRHGVPSLLWYESHRLSSRFTGAISSFMRTRLLQGFEGALIPGDPQLRSLIDVGWDVPTERTVIVPNVVDENRFVRGVDALRSKRSQIRAGLQVLPAHQLWVMICRLDKEKGVRPFIRRLRGVQGVTCLIAGTGKQERALRTEARMAALPVRFIGHQDEQDIIALLAAADCFVLPSIRDPSPLAVVEAAAAALPLLVSERIGNANDVLVEGHNGYGFDPLDPYSIDSAVASIQLRTHQELREMGRRSRRRHRSIFSTTLVVSRLAKKLTEIAV